MSISKNVKSMLIRESRIFKNKPPNAGGCLTPELNENMRKRKPAQAICRIVVMCYKK